jgi:hypothetical protein
MARTGRWKKKNNDDAEGKAQAQHQEYKGSLGDLWCAVALRGSGLRKSGPIHCSDGMGRFGDRRRAHSLTVHACMHAVQVRNCEGGG